MEVKDENIVLNPATGKFVCPTIVSPSGETSMEDFYKTISEYLSDEDKLQDVVEKLYSVALFTEHPMEFMMGYMARALMENECEECRKNRSRISVESMDVTDETLRIYHADRLEKSGKARIAMSKVIMSEEFEEMLHGNEPDPEDNPGT